MCRLYTMENNGRPGNTLCQDWRNETGHEANFSKSQLFSHLFCIGLLAYFLQGEKLPSRQKRRLSSTAVDNPPRIFSPIFQTLHVQRYNLLGAIISNLNYLIQNLKKKMIQKKYFHFFMIILSKIDIWPHFCFKIPSRYFLIHESLRSQDTCFRILNTFGNVRN